MFCVGHAAAGAGSWRPQAVGVVQGVQTKTLTGKSQLLQEEEREIGFGDRDQVAQVLQSFSGT